MDWADISSWPNADLSRRVQGPIHRWHIQEAGKGETMLLLHGAGGSTHSYRRLIAPLSEHQHVIALDLPGHGFTQLGARHRSTLDGMAQAIAALCAQEGWTPRTIVGHSAGAAVALRLVQPDLTPSDHVPMVIGLNAALGEFPGLAGVVFPIIAKALAAVPFTASLFSGASGNPKRIEALIRSTGSTLDAEGLELYRRLVADRAHVDGTLLMMAQWKLPPLLRALPDHKGPVRFIVGEQDATVPPTVSLTTAKSMPDARVTNLPDLGHLAHEEDPATVADLILGFVDAAQGATPT
ncbi:alpha/beta fold hydrolase BchO [uncultured Tateyamaria sp.]|uniref:alpha/beta fold hydrolase BchO n=1 Tax=uncultured Tateyamaria sp. TaxID=455651 RepID=UPI00262F330D|nr:alpha/beta fold hydrolase BchO [uncultured Tateyamaria sp.]